MMIKLENYTGYLEPGMHLVSLDFGEKAIVLEKRRCEVYCGFIYIFCAIQYSLDSWEVLSFGFDIDNEWRISETEQQFDAPEWLKLPEFKPPDHEEQTND